MMFKKGLRVIGDSLLVKPRSSRQLLLTIYCLLLTVFTGCGHKFIITKDPLKAEEHVSLAQAYASKGEIELAIQEYKKAIEIDKAQALAYFGLGNIAIKKGQYADAENYYKKAIEYAPPDDARSALFYNNLSWTHIEGKKDLREAEQLAQKALMLDAAQSYIYLDTLGVIYTQLKDYPKAEETLLSALQSAEYNEIAQKHIYQHLSELYRLTGNEMKLKEALQKLNNPGDK